MQGMKRYLAIWPTFNYPWQWETGIVEIIKIHRLSSSFSLITCTLLLLHQACWKCYLKMCFDSGFISFHVPCPPKRGNNRKPYLLFYLQGLIKNLDHSRCSKNIELLEQDEMEGKGLCYSWTGNWVWALPVFADTSSRTVFCENLPFKVVIPIHSFIHRCLQWASLCIWVLDIQQRIRWTRLLPLWILDSSWRSQIKKKSKLKIVSGMY